MPRFSGERLLAVGALIAGLGGSAAIAYYVYVQEEVGRKFWTAFGIAAVVALVVGLVLAVIGLLRQDSGAFPSQEQSSGDHSTNLQAGGDIRLRHDLNRSSEDV